MLNETKRKERMHSVYQRMYNSKTTNNCTFTFFFSFFFFFPFQLMDSRTVINGSFQNGMARPQVADIQMTSKYAAQLRIYWIISRGRQTIGGPPAWVLGEALTTHCLKNLTILRKSHKSLWIGQVACCCECGNEPSCFTTCGEFIE
jgi:hypothetical protein